nr:sulfatase-like hydrolase/transferase [Legionella sp. PL877]
MTAILLLSAGITLTEFTFRNQSLSVAKTISQLQAPNLIIIGVDSIGPGNINAKDTPNLYRFLGESVHFTEAISPLARTYAAWTSILTGLYPLHHGVRYNLMPPGQIKNLESFAWVLQQKGYHTVFATDERRFSPMDKEFGFQEIIAPKLGVNDLLLGTFYDFPLSNFLINLPISRWLFPYNHINRASHFSYYPESFNRALAKSVTQQDPQKPLFMAVHFALPHWPYAWATSTFAEVRDEYSVETKEQSYLNAVREADNQVGIFLNNLNQAGLLNNSMVILLSDHGEVLYEPGTRMTKRANYTGDTPDKLADYFIRNTSTTLEISTGHGSDLLSPSQFHCLLGFKIFKHNQLGITPKTITTRVALIDIAPTVYSFLDLSLKRNFDGISLFDAIISNHSLPEQRFFLLESGELPNQIVSKEQARILGKLFYRVNPDNNQLQLREDRLPALDALKLYAILQEDWLVALYPDDNEYLTVILRLSDGKWTDDLNSSFAQTSPVKPMLKQLQQFYKEELATYPKSRVSLDLIE